MVWNVTCIVSCVACSTAQTKTPIDHLRVPSVGNRIVLGYLLAERGMIVQWPTHHALGAGGNNNKSYSLFFVSY